MNKKSDTDETRINSVRSSNFQRGSEKVPGPSIKESELSLEQRMQGKTLSQEEFDIFLAGNHLEKKPAYLNGKEYVAGVPKERRPILLFYKTKAPVKEKKEPETTYTFYTCFQ